MFKQKKGLKKLSKTALIAILLLFLLVLFIFITKEKTLPQEKEIVKIGFLGDFSNNRLLSENALAAAKIAIDDVNKLYDKKFELIVYDKANNPLDAIKSANKDNVLALVNIYSIPTSNLTEKLMPIITVADIKKEYLERDAFYWGIHFAFFISDYVDQHIALIKSKYKNIKSAAFVIERVRIFSDTKSGKLTLNPVRFINNLESLNDVQTSIYNVSDSEFIDIIKDIEQKNPDVILLLTDISKSIQFLKTAKENGLEDKLFLVFLPTTKELLLEEGNMPKRLIIAAPPTNVLGTTTPPANAFEEFANKYTSLAGDTVGHLALNAYDTVSLIAYSISKANITNMPETVQEDREKILKELWAIKNFKSLRGILTPDGKTGNFKRNYISSFYIENGRFKSARGVIV